MSNLERERSSLDRHAGWFFTARWSFILGTFFVVAAVGGHFSLEAQSTPSDPYTPYAAIAFAVAALLFLAAGVGLLRRKNWARRCSVWLWGISALAMAALGLFTIPAMILAGVRLARDEWRSLGMTPGMVVGILLGMLVMLGGIVSFFVISLQAFARMRYLRSDDAKRTCFTKGGASGD